MLQEIITYLIITVALGVVALRVLKKYSGKKEDESCATGERPESKGCGGCDAACPIKEKRASQHSSLY